MKAIRGATTVSRDSAEEIKNSVKELLDEIVKVNALKIDDVVCINFTNTADIRSFYPARAAREAGYYLCPLFSAQEPDIDGALKLCIRVMLLVDNVDSVKHVYLNGAKALRRDVSSVYNIALDGPAGSGKSTVAKILAKKLNILCLDTGAMYRACALKCLKEKVDINCEKAVEKVVKNINLAVEYKNGEQITLLDGENVSKMVRNPEISIPASKVSAYACVREKMVDMQRKIAQKTSCILDGRDIGTNVLKNAAFKFYLTASAEERAKRRFGQNGRYGYGEDFEKVLKEIIARDEQDKNRKIAPLKVADDAIVIDSTNMSVDDVIKFIEKKIQEKI